MAPIGLGALSTILVWLFAMPAQCFQFGEGELKGALDTTLSYGTSWRVADQDSAL
ncbi:MAG: DUF1302 domain-containing protein, partial [Alphaproteobacteria bacterium]|nr:DUF1302 domain-containing protein [Alphaproteobacteria bacterium]